jgi:hypothetical protein
MSERKPFRKFRNTGPSLTIEQKIEQFILRNSKNGYFTKVSTINYKFEISESKAWEIVGELLFNGNIESIHDQNTGDMKLCENEKTFQIMELERIRNRDRFRNKKKSSVKLNKKPIKKENNKTQNS